MSGLIVVAVDPSTGSPSALRWAVDEARIRGADLHAVMAWHPPRPPAAPAGRPPVVTTLDDGDPQAEADSRLAALVEAAIGSRHPTRRSAVRGATLPVLIEAATTADLLVLDPPRPTDLTRARSTLLAPQLVFKVTCPVVVIPPTSP